MTLLFILFGFSVFVMVEKGFKPKIITCKTMQMAENATCKLHFLLAFCKYSSVSFEPCKSPEGEALYQISKL